MTPEPRTVRVSALLFGGVLVAWWLYGIDWLDKPGSYRISVAYTVVVIVAAVVHGRALWRYNRMVRQVRKEEEKGTIEEGSTLFAANQRFRYIVRILESAMVLGLGVVGIIAVKHPAVALNPNYTKLFVTYLMGSVAVTGYLTFRDLRVLQIMRKIDNAAIDHASLKVTPAPDLANTAKPRKRKSTSSTE